MKKYVLKYVCVFLNSGEEGILYIGVNDDSKLIKYKRKVS